MRILLSSSKWSLFCVPSFMRRVKRHCFKKSLLVRDFVIYKLSNLSHKPAVVSSSATSRKTSSARQSYITLCVFISSSSFSSSDMNSGNLSLPDKTFNKPCCTKRARILTLHKLKLFLPSNFFTLYFAEAISKPTRN